MKGNLKFFKLKNLLEVLEFNRSSYYSALKLIQKNDLKEEQDIKDAKIIYKIFKENKSQIGYRIVAKKLREKGIIWNHKKIQRLMLKFGIIAPYVRKMKLSQAVRSRTTYKNAPDLIQRKFKEVKKPLTVFYTDVTYLILKGKKAYQSTIIDGATKEIIDYRISTTNDNHLVLENLRCAMQKIKTMHPYFFGGIIHSDHGYQYTSEDYQKLCRKENLTISMGRAYTCTDNVVIESYHSLLKKGTIHNNDYKTLDEYVEDVKDWNNWYNRQKCSNFLLNI